MATFNKNKLNLIGQGVAGPKMWHYSDTGLLIADVSEVSGFFTTGYDCGMRRGDFVYINEGDTGTYDTAGRQTGGRRLYGATILASVDTGATQVTLGLPVLIGDTS